MDVQEPLWYVSWSPVMMDRDHNVSKISQTQEHKYCISFICGSQIAHIYKITHTHLQRRLTMGKIRGRKKERVWWLKMVRIHDILEIKKIQCLSKCLYVCCMHSYYLPAYYIFSILWFVITGRKYSQTQNNSACVCYSILLNISLSAIFVYDIWLRVVMKS